MTYQPEPTLSMSTGTGLVFSVSFARWDAFQSDRARWNWEIRHDGTSDHGEVIARGDDLTTVCDDRRPNIVTALETMMAFAEWAPELCGPDWERMMADGVVDFDSTECRAMLAPETIDAG
jgi:hypothetical protein